jgi:hypothetical protein
MRKSKPQAVGVSEAKKERKRLSDLAAKNRPKPLKLTWKWRDCTVGLSVENIPFKRCITCGQASIQRMKIDEFSLLFDVCMGCGLVFHLV